METLKTFFCFIPIYIDLTIYSIHTGTQIILILFNVIDISLQATNCTPCRVMS